MYIYGNNDFSGEIFEFFTTFFNASKKGTDAITKNRIPNQK
jgi:hypothetical protein